MNIFRRFQLARDSSVTVANLVDELVRRKGDCEVSVGENGPFYLAELHSNIRSIDAFLRSIALKPGQPVAIYRSNNRQSFHWFLAIIRAGGIAVPLNPLLSITEVRRILADSGTDILVTDKAVFERNIADRQALNVSTWIQADDEPETLDGFVRAPGFGTDTGTPFPPTAIDPAATVAVFHTSGTSGFPKGAALSSNALLGARASTVLAGLFLSHRDLALIALPWSHIMAVSIALYGLMAGIRGCFLDRFDVASALSLIDVLASPPSSASPRCSPGWSIAILNLPGWQACARGSRPATTCPAKSGSVCTTMARWSGCHSAGAFRRYS